MQPAPLVPGPLGTRADVPGADPLAVWADATALREHRRPGAPLPALLPLVLRLADGADAGRLPAALQVPPALRDAQARVLTARAPRALARRLLRGEVAGVAAAELSAPVLPQRPRPLPAAGLAPAPVAAMPAVSAGHAPLLLAAIDSACPFAHRLLRRADGGTRLLAIWDQDPDAPAFAAAGGRPPAGFGYGAEATRAGLDALIAAHSGPAGTDEDRLYEAAGYALLRHGFGHGAAVLSLLAAEPGHEAPRRRADDAAPGGDLAFVQIPRDAVQDSGSASLPRYVIDGLHYLAALARPGQRLVVNLSDGSSRGAHDGSMLVQQAIAEIVAAQRARGVEMHVVIAAGNSADEERHALFDALAPGAAQAVWLRVPPANESPVHVTLRLPARGWQVVVTPPGGAPAAVRPGQALGWSQPGAALPAAGLVLAAAAPGAPSLGLLGIAPTRRGEDAATPPPAGDWRIEICRDEGAGAGDAHLWVSRGQRNAGALPRARQARFVDHHGGYDPARARRSARTDPVPPTSPIRRAGTLNTLATMAAPGVWVVGASLHHERCASPYTAAGPALAAGPGRAARAGPDAAAAVDAHAALRGLRVGGTRSGDTRRATGSSFAAPQVARQLALHGGLDLAAPAAPDPARLGAGILARR